MRKGVIIICRFGSKRLPGKILLEIQNKPILLHIVDSLKKVTQNVIVATSNDKTDQPIIDFCKKNHINYFRGSLNDVSLRFLKAAEEYNLDYAVRINGDNLFVNIDVLTKILLTPQSKLKDIITNVPGRTYPFGMSVEMLFIPFYKQWYPSFSKEHKEHVTLYFYENPTIGSRKIILNKYLPEAKGINLAIDTKEDFKRATYILKNIMLNEEYNFQKLVQTAIKYENN